MIGQAYDLIAVGALNSDYIIHDSAIPNGHSDDEDLIRRKDALKQLKLRESKTFHPDPGGSAFNTLKAVASLSCGLRLGFLGALGTQDGGEKFLDLLDRFRMPRKFVRKIANDRPGVCIATVERGSGQRYLQTNPFANEGMAEWLGEAWKKYRKELSSTRMLHVSSLFDDKLSGRNSSSSALVAFVRNMRAKNPGLIVSFDPGSYWIRKKREIVESLLEHADILFLNEREMSQLARLDGEPVSAALAKTIFKIMPRRSTIIVLKKADDAHCFQRHSSDEIETRQFGANRLANSDIRNPVGTGDLFAAGFLTSILLQFDLNWAVRLGQELACEKLRHIKPKELEAGCEKIFAETRDLLARPVTRRWDDALQRATKRFHSYAMALAERPTRSTKARGIANPDRPTISILDEYDVRYLFQAVLKSEWAAVEPEVQTTARAGQSGRCDFAIPAGKILVECKYVNGADDQKRIVDSFDSILRRYKTHLDYDRLFVFIYDPYRKLHNAAAILELQGPRKGLADVRIGISRPA